MTDLKRHRALAGALVFSLAMATSVATGALGVAPAAAAPAAPTAPLAVQPITVTVTITDVFEVSCDEGALVPCPDDYFSNVDIAGQGFQESGHQNNPDPPDVHPNWQFSRSVGGDVCSVPIVIELWDHDDSSANDKLDVSSSGDEINLSLDLGSGNWFGDVPGGVGESQGANARVLFNVSLSGNRDIDGDGIPDCYERSGIRDMEGNVVSNIGAMGADPCRKSIAVEIDFMAAAGHTHRPLDAAIAESVAMFDDAPVPAVADCPYSGFPRQSSGIDLIIVVDDPIPEQAVMGWGDGGETVRQNNFNSNLRPYFHYSLWVHDRAAGSSSSGVCCSNSTKDPLVSLGSWTNGVGSAREQSGTFVHELGHALGLGHGGGEGINFKPNYLSAMSYAIQVTGVPDPTLPANNVDTNNDGVADARFRLDYSRQALPSLNESALDENVGISDGTDLTTWSVNGGGTLSAAGNGPIDWDNDGPIEASVAVDLNDRGSSPASPGETLTGFDDWSNLRFRAALSPDAGFDPGNHVNELDFETAQAIRQEVLEALEPVADPGGPYSGAEGSAVSFDGSGSLDPSGGGLSFEWDFGDGTTGTGPTPTHSYVDDGDYTVTLKVTGGLGLSSSAQTTASISNVAPTLTIDPDQVTSLAEGDTVTVTAAFSDPGLLDEPFAAEVDWGAPVGQEGQEGEVTVTVTDPGGAGTPLQGVVTATYTYGDNDDGSGFPITVTLTDKDGGSGSDSIQLSASNVNPTVSITSQLPTIDGVPTVVGRVGEPVTIEGLVEDPGSDDLTITWDLGDGTNSERESLVNPPDADPLPSPTVQPRSVPDNVSHTYDRPCMYEATFTATDDDTGTSTSTSVAVLITSDAEHPLPPLLWLVEYANPLPIRHLDEETLQCYLDITNDISQVFDEARPLADFEDAVDVLVPPLPLLSERTDVLDRELLAAWLNFAHGTYRLDDLIDTNKDSVRDTEFWTVLQTAETVRLNPNSTNTELFKQARLIARINNDCAPPNGLLDVLRCAALELLPT
ncbi:MAG TPA: PKD domain-containing protein [Acidimicrobiales bacterium]|nr:PKD domain-containing protein [Acidimicrobiales bacterium]